MTLTTRSPARRRDVPTPVIAKLSLSHLGIVAVRVEPRAEEAGARETLRSVLETSLNAEVTTLSAAIREEEAVKAEKAIRVIAMSSETFVCVVPRRFLEVTKMVCQATARDAPASTAPWRVTEVSVCQGKGEEMDVLRSMIPKLVMDAFKEVEGWCAFGESENATRFMHKDFWPDAPNAIVTAYGVEIERGISVTKAPPALDRDIGEDCEIELMFPSINAVVLRLQRFGSIIDAMRDVGVSNTKMREFVHGSSVIDISSTPIMAQAAPEIGVEVVVIAFRRELPRSIGFKTIQEFRLAFAARLNTFVPPYVHINDSKEELICDVCFPGHDVPYLWPVSLLLKSTGATELTARQSNIANDSILAWLRSATNLNILQTHLSFHINKCAFMPQNVAPCSGPTLPEREIFVTASQNRSGWPAFTARDNHMPHCMDIWINPFSSQYLSDVVPEIFSPHTTIPVSLSTPSSLPSCVKDLSEGDLFLGGGSNPFEELDRATNVSPPETVEPSKRAKIDSQEDEPAPVLGSRVTAEGIQNAAKQKSSRSDVSKLTSRIAKTCGVKFSDVSEHLTKVCSLIEAGQYNELTCSRRNSLEHALSEVKLLLKDAETLKTRTKQRMIEYISTHMKLRKCETEQS